jgi:hypothetical protein
MADPNNIDELESGAIQAASACRGGYAMAFVGSGNIKAYLVRTKNGAHVRYVHDRPSGARRISRVKAAELLTSYVQAWGPDGELRKRS